MYGDNTHDAYAHATAPKVITKLTIEDAYFEYYKENTDKSLNQHFILFVLHSLQGHP